MTADPRRVVAVLELAAEMLAEGEPEIGIRAAAVRRMGIDPTERRALWLSALDAEPYHRGTEPRRDQLLAAAATLRRHILAASLFCAGLAGWLDSTAAALIAQHVAGDEGALETLLDLAEERGLGGEGTWECVEVAWPEAREHEHTWLPYVRGDDTGTMRSLIADYGSIGALPRSVRRCPCGVFEHEETVVRCLMCAASAEVMLRFDGETRREPVCMRHWSTEEHRYSWSERLPGRSTPTYLPGPDDGLSPAWLAECVVCSRFRVMTRPGHTADDIAHVTRELRVRCECAFESVRELGSPSRIGTFRRR